jgi:cytochrome P450
MDKGDTSQMPELDPYDHRFQWNPYPYYQALRERDPVYFNRQRGFWLLTKWDDVSRAFHDYRTFSSAGAVALEADAVDKFPYPMFISTDPPQHGPVRRLFVPLLSPEPLKALEDYIRRKTRALLEPHMARGRIDFVGDLACYLPMDVISMLMRIPSAEQDGVRGWADDMIAREDKQHDLSERNVSGYVNLAKYFEELVRAHANDDHREDLLGALLRGEKSGVMAHDEVIGALILLAIAGNETTTKTIANMAYRLWQNPQQRGWLATDPALIPNAIEEVLRFDGSSQIIARILSEDVEMRGKHLKKGQRVGLCIISANRDPDKFKDPDVFDVRRGSREHMAFGHGIHACLGSALARLEIRVVFEEVLRCMPNYEIDEAGLRLAHNPNVRGFTHVPARFTPVDRGAA